MLSGLFRMDYGGAATPECNTHRVRSRRALGQHCLYAQLVDVVNAVYIVQQWRYV